MQNPCWGVAISTGHRPAIEVFEPFSAEIAYQMGVAGPLQLPIALVGSCTGWPVLPDFGHDAGGPRRLCCTAVARKNQHDFRIKPVFPCGYGPGGRCMLRR